MYDLLDKTSETVNDKNTNLFTQRRDLKKIKTTMEQIVSTINDRNFESFAERYKNSNTSYEEMTHLGK